MKILTLILLACTLTSCCTKKFPKKESTPIQKESPAPPRNTLPEGAVVRDFVTFSYKGNQLDSSFAIETDKLQITSTSKKNDGSSTLGIIEIKHILDTDMGVCVGGCKKAMIVAYTLGEQVPFSIGLEEDLKRITGWGPGNSVVLQQVNINNNQLSLDDFQKHPKYLVVGETKGSHLITVVIQYVLTP